MSGVKDLVAGWSEVAETWWEDVLPKPVDEVCMREFISVARSFAQHHIEPLSETYSDIRKVKDTLEQSLARCEKQMTLRAAVQKEAKCLLSLASVELDMSVAFKEYVDGESCFYAHLIECINAHPSSWEDADIEVLAGFSWDIKLASDSKALVEIKHELLEKKGAAANAFYKDYLSGKTQKLLTDSFIAPLLEQSLGAFAGSFAFIDRMDFAAINGLEDDKVADALGPLLGGAPHKEMSEMVSECLRSEESDDPITVFQGLQVSLERHRRGGGVNHSMRYVVSGLKGHVCSNSMQPQKLASATVSASVRANLLTLAGLTSLPPFPLHSEPFPCSQTPAHMGSRMFVSLTRHSLRQAH